LCVRFGLAGEFFERPAPSNDLAHHDAESHSVREVAIIEAERLFVQIPEQVKGFNAEICSVQAALQ
jgi:hypothetical protein